MPTVVADSIKICRQTRFLLLANKHKVRDKTCSNYYITAQSFHILVNVFSLFVSPFGLQFSIIKTKALCKAVQEGHS